MANYESEKLQETLLDLMRSRERERQLKEENKAILAGMAAMAGANNKRQVFNSLLGVLSKFIGFEHALVLTREDELSPLKELVTTCRYFESSVWPIADTFTRSINGESIALFDSRQVVEFQELPSNLMQYCRSVLLTGVKVSSGDAVLIFLHSEKGKFSSNCKRVLEHFRPLLERAIIDIDYRERLQSLVTARTLELSHSQQRFKDFARTVGDWFWEIDTEYFFSYISSPSLSTHSIDSASILEIFSHDPETAERLKARFSAEQPFEDIEWQLPPSEGSGWMSISGTPYYNKQGQFLGFRGTTKDITSRKQHMMELQKARQQAEDANKAKSQFLAMMSHEIRTPLNAVMGLMDLLADSGLGKQQLSWIDQMDQSAQLLLTIINDILDLSRIESESFELYESTMRIMDSVDLVVTQLQEQANKKGVLLNAKSDPDVPEYMFGDKNRVSQVLFNLVGNAIKFTDTGSVDIYVSQQDQNLQLTVTDTGIGISEEAQAMLFNPFIQADGSITRKYGGTGLGLAISQHLVNKMGGKIILKSTLGKGSCFTVNLPLKAMTVNREIKVPSFKASTHLPPLRILVAEDSPTNQLVVKLMLEKRGHQVNIAPNGQMAVEMIADGKGYDLILMDISMPVMDGIQATKILRSHGIKLPIIALTANVMRADQEKYQQVGMNGLLAKPIIVKELELILFESQLALANGDYKH
ncbi:chemotaxis protein CheY [Photobacterium aquae]|uniref:histidine kinase n=1 Tax=Photobacterium aquae TaxID=1195763 RepID=A0A0J1H6C5_9GAMM|nr:PAS domain-containing hybrid sensor histidine kinase/response regulator [Photobacterium aquae]KLV07288.1 chemotaxis protein CheY [Photobacterium aquae]